MHKNKQQITSADCEARLNRRHFLALAAGVGASAALPEVNKENTAAAQTAPALVKIPTRPQAPYRVWGGAEFFNRNTEIYSNMTLDGNGHLDPRIVALTGKLSLDAVEGTQTTNARGSYYWKNPCDRARRTRAAFKTLPPIASAGIAVMDWGGPLPEKKPDNEKWMLEGLREGKKANPDCFVAAWVSQPNNAMFEAGRDGTVNLFLIQGFTHSTPELAQAKAVTWDNAMARCEAFKAAGLLPKTIFAFGEIDRDALLDGKKLSKEWLGEKMREVKKRYPEMPGVAFLQTSTTRSDGTIDLIRYWNALSVELWPNSPAI